MKRLLSVTSLFLVLLLAAPASAATWRNVAAVRTVDGLAAVTGSMRNVEDIQIGIKNQGAGARFEWDAFWSCERGFNFVSKNKDGSVWVGQGRTRWVTIRNAGSAWDSCSYSPAVNERDFNTHPFKLRVRVR